MHECVFKSGALADGIAVLAGGGARPPDRVLLMGRAVVAFELPAKPRCNQAEQLDDILAGGCFGTKKMTGTFWIQVLTRHSECVNGISR